MKQLTNKFYPTHGPFMFFPAALFVMAAIGVAGCGGASESGVSVSSDTSAKEHYRLGLEAAEARDFPAALAQFEAAYKKEPSSDRSLAVGHTLFMAKRYEDALKYYRSYANESSVTKRRREKINAEITRIEGPVEKGEEPTGRSLAGQWLRGSLAMTRALDNVELGQYSQAAENFDKAYQYTTEAEFLYEAGLAASKAEDWSTAHRKFNEYLSIGAEDVPADLSYRIGAEIDRLSVLMEGGEPVTNETLADQIYEQRKGELELEELPPSIAAAESDAGVDEPSEMVEVEPSLPEAGIAEVFAAEEPEPEASEAQEAKPVEEKTDVEKEKVDKKAEIAAKKAARKEALAAKKALKKAKVEERRQAQKEKKAAKKAERERKKAEKKAALAEKKALKKQKAEERRKAREEKLAAKKAETEAKQEAVEKEPASNDKKTETTEGAAFEAALAPPEIEKKIAKKPVKRKIELQDLIFYSRSKTAAVRMRAVKDLISVPNDSARQVLEERMVRDTNIHIRIAAIRGLVARRSRASVPLMRRTTITVTTSQERAILKQAVAEIISATSSM